MVNFQKRLRLKTHQFHAYRGKVLYLLHLRLIQPNFLPAQWVKCADLVLVEGVAGFLAD
jgi:hypothetical protein